MTAQPSPRRPAEGLRAPPAHLEALTGIRGIAAWLVVLYHIRLSLTDILPAPVIGVFAKGYLAVDLFFILSGFVLWYNYADRLRAGGPVEAGRFLWRRLARIWPLHAFVLSLFVAFALALVVTGRDASFYPFAQLPLHVLLVQNWGFTSALAWNDPAWSISTEMAAYLLFPLVAAAAPWARLRSTALLALASAIAAAVALVFWAHGEGSIGARIPQLGLWRCLLEFSLGNVLCLLWLRWRERPGAAKLALAACTAIAVAGLGLGWPETLVAPAAFFAGLLALALSRGPLARALGGPVLRYLGEISYSTYLAHTFLFLVFKLAFVNASLQLGWTGLGGFLLLVLAASATLYHGVEKPAQRWLTRHRPRRPIGAVPAE